MAVINFTQADRMASSLIETAWYPLTISGIEGPKASSSGKSVTFFVTFKIRDGEYASKEFVIAYNTGTKNPSVLGTQQYFPHTYLMPLYAAAFNVNQKDVPSDFDTDALLMKDLDGKVEKGIHDGVPMNTIIAFLPLGQGQNQKVPF